MNGQSLDLQETKATTSELFPVTNSTRLDKQLAEKYIFYGNQRQQAGTLTQLGQSKAETLDFAAATTLTPRKSQCSWLFENQFIEGELEQQMKRKGN